MFRIGMILSWLVGDGEARRVRRIAVRDEVIHRDDRATLGGEVAACARLTTTAVERLAVRGESVGTDLARGICDSRRGGDPHGQVWKTLRVFRDVEIGRA